MDHGQGKQINNRAAVDGVQRAPRALGSIEQAERMRCAQRQALDEDGHRAPAIGDGASGHGVAVCRNVRTLS